jgi:hypothetical protein
VTTKITVTSGNWKPDNTTRALYVLHDIYGADIEVRRRDMSIEPVKFARYLLDNPEKWIEAQEISELRDRAWARTSG